MEEEHLQLDNHNFEFDLRSYLLKYNLFVWFMVRELWLYYRLIKKGFGKTCFLLVQILAGTKKIIKVVKISTNYDILTIQEKKNS